MTARELVLPRVVGTSTGSIATATTVNLTNDFNLNTLLGTNFRPLDRIVIVIRATTAGTTDATSFSVQDANDNAGSIAVLIGVQLQSGRPWLRIRATRASGTTDTLAVSAVVLAAAHSL
jgi:hypothetical protein